MNIPRRIFVLAVLVSAAAHAADLKITLDTANLRLRKGAPIPLEVRFENPTPRMLEGRLEITLLFGDRKAGVHRSGELVLQPGARTLPLLVPPPAEAHEGDGIAARLRWLGADGVRDIGEQRIGIYGIGGHEVVLAIARTERRLSDLDHARDASLNVESLRPALDAASWLTFTTLHANLPVQHLPVHPLGWCAYDAVFLDGSAFSAANEKQLTALARWVEAGGGVALCADVPLSERHVLFLDRLGASEPSPARFTLDHNGMLVRSGTAPLLLRPGLGRAFVATAPGSKPKDFDRNEWRAAVAWLWKFRESEQREVARTGRWSKDFIRNHQVWRGPDDVELTAAWSAAAGFNALTPGAPRRMPLGLVALVLGALLVAVGPADWFALGWMRRRRWTWVVFPVACAATAWWTAHLAGKYLGVEDRKGRIRFVDLGDDGRVLRDVSYEMLLPARDREWILDLHDAIAVPVPRSQARLPANPPPSVVAATVNHADSVSEWPSPGHFILRRTLRQWSPAMVRITSMRGAIEGAQPDWDAALAHFRGNPAAEFWKPGDATDVTFEFKIPKRDGSDASYNRYTMGPLPGGNGDDGAGNDDSFVRWIAFGGDPRELGGLGTSVSPLLAGTSDLVHAVGWSRDRRVLCAWRRTGGELLIYRRSFPAK